MVIEKPTGARTNINGKWEAIYMRQTVILSRDQNLASFAELVLRLGSNWTLIINFIDMGFK